MKNLVFILLIVLFSPNLLSAQRDSIVEQDSSALPTLNEQEIARIRNGEVIRGKIIDGDTVMHIYMSQITVIPPFIFESKRQRKRYGRLVRYVKKVYPYSQLIKAKLIEVNTQLDTITDDKERRKFIKLKEKELREDFEDELVSMTIIQGRILMRLVDRETGYTTYELLESLKGSVSAIFWQSIARVFGSNLKTGYDASGDDAMIEDIIIRIENGEL